MPPCPASPANESAGAPDANDATLIHTEPAATVTFFAVPVPATEATNTVLPLRTKLTMCAGTR